MDKQYQKDSEHIWAHRLISEWHKIQLDLKKNHNIILKTPAFEINEKKWGQYYRRISDNKPTIKLSYHLLENFHWGAIIHVLKHEVAHMIVDISWKMSDLRSHGEAFKKACTLLDVDFRRCSNIKDLLNEDNEQNKKERIVRKIKKLMSLSSSTEQAEAETALNKAEELMLKYNIKELDERKEEEYMFRPIGPLMKRVPNYIRDLSNLVSKYYFVDYILCSCNYRQKYYEFFGTKENLDIAEYIFCSLLRQAEKLWEIEKKSIQKKYGGVRGIASKASFIEGLFSGYSAKLHKQESNREKNQSSNISEALIWTGDPLQKEMYKKTYPNVKYCSYNRTARSGGFHSGYKKGQDLSLNAGLRSNSSNGNKKILLTK